MASEIRTSRPRSGRRASRPIGLSALRGFEAAARHLSFTLAADELNLTQSSISRQVASLESQLGKPLFVRHTRALELTAAGDRLHNSVRLALATIDRTVGEIRGREGPPRVSVATYASLASLWLVPRLAAFQSVHPDVEFRIDAADRYVDLEAEEIDVALRWVRTASTPPNATLLCEDAASPALSPRLLETSGVTLAKPGDLASLPLLELDDSVPEAPYSGWARWFEFAKASPKLRGARINFTYIDQAVQAAVRGQGASIVHTPFIDDFVASGELIEPFPHLRMRTGYRYFLVVNPRRAQLPQVKIFCDWVIAQFAPGTGSA